MTHLSDETKEALAEAWVAYKERVRALLEPHTDETLMAFARGATTDSTRIERDVAQNIVAYRFHLARARASHAHGYCVYHAQDARLCDPKDHA